MSTIRTRRRRTLRRLAGPVLALALLAALAAPAHATSPKRLLARYQPVTVFAAGEAFTPTSVAAFIRDARLETRDASGGFVLADPNPSRRTLPTADTALCQAAGLRPCWRLDQTACSPVMPLGGLACYAAAFGEERPSIVYGRVVRGRDRIVLQYWLFYYANVYSYEDPPTDLVWQSHEGDWEVVNVVLTARERPRFVGYSQHCTGERRAWAATPRLGRTHPIVHVALGSHANLFAAGTHPIEPRCLPPEAIAFFERAGLPLPADHAGDASLAGPARAGGTVTAVRRIARVWPRWVRFPGAWGELEAMHAPSPIDTRVTGYAPVGPALHDVWTHPLRTLRGWPRG